MKLDLSFLESTDSVEINNHAAGYRQQRVVSTSDTSVIFPDTVETSNGKFELKAVTQEEQVSVTAEIDEGRLENLTIDISAYDGVKGVDLSI